MRIVFLIALCCAAVLPSSALPSDPEIEAIVKKAFDAVGGEAKLLRLFRARENFRV